MRQLNRIDYPEAQQASVLLVTSEYPPHLCGGLGTHVLSITTALANRVQFDILTLKYGDYVSSARSVRIHEVAVPRSRTDVEFWLHFAAAARAVANRSVRGASLIHCHDWMTAVAGLSLRRLLGIPMVFNVHLPQSVGSRSAMEDLGLAGADLVIVNSLAARAEVTSRKIRIQRIEVVPNGVDHTLFHPSPQWPADGGYVLFVGRLVAQKGCDALLRAFRVLMLRCPEARLIVAGDGDLELYLKRLAAHLGVHQQVSFVSWRTGKSLVRLYQGAQLVVVPSYYEPFGMVALEAMACGRPVVASATGGLSEIMRDGGEGFLVPPGDYLRLAARIADLLGSPRLRHRMGEHGRATARRFSWSAVAERTHSLYQEVSFHHATHSTKPAPTLQKELIRPLLGRGMISLINRSLGRRW